MESREIKFRAWHLDDKMLFFDFCTFEKDYHDQYGNIMQYTGLKDNNGVDIYEGDLFSVRHSQNLSIVSFNSDNYGKVMGWNLIDIKGEAREFFYGCSPGPWGVVVGNIYENPELLKDEK